MDLKLGFQDRAFHTVLQTLDLVKPAGVQPPCSENRDGLRYKTKGG